MTLATCATVSYNSHSSRHILPNSRCLQPIADQISLNTAIKHYPANGALSPAVQPVLDARFVNIDGPEDFKTHTSPCIFATLAGSFSGFSLGGNGEQQQNPSDEFQTQNIYPQHGLHALPQPGSYMQPPAQHHAIPSVGRHYSIAHGATSIDAGPSHYHPHYHHMAQQPQHPPQQYGAGPSQQDYTIHHARGKRPRSQDSLALEVEGLQGYTTNISPSEPAGMTPGGHQIQFQAPNIHYGAPQTQTPSQTHHHHRMPGPPPSKLSRGTYGGPAASPPQATGPPSVVGQEGMPAPAPRPRGPKLKFTGEDDQLLVDLKERKNLTWKQIADFFPGRSSGTLQVRYCTKLKAKTTVWNDEMVQKLRNAIQEYETDRWRIISSKVGSGFTPIACKQKADELEGLEDTGIEERTEEAEEADD